LTAPGSPALLILVSLLVMFVCHAAESVTKSIKSGKVAVITELQLIFLRFLLSPLFLDVLHELSNP
jgi:hypothetical protein